MIVRFIPNIQNGLYLLKIENNHLLQFYFECDCYPFLEKSCAMSGEIVDNAQQISDSKSSRFRALDLIVNNAEKPHSQR